MTRVRNRITETPYQRLKTDIWSFHGNIKRFMVGLICKDCQRRTIGVINEDRIISLGNPK